MTPVTAVLGCWIIALLLGVYHGPSLGADALRLEELGETNSTRSALPKTLAWIAAETRLSGLQSTLDGPKKALYDAEAPLGGVLAVAEEAPPATLLPPEDEVEEPVFVAPSPLVEPSRVLIMGASSIQYELGRALERHYKEREGVEVRRFGKHSTGLARPDYFNWPEKAIELVDDFEPDLVIAQYGGNDGQGLANLRGRGVARFGSEQWKTLYSERVTSLVTSLQNRGVTVVILGMPVMKKVSHRRRINSINEVTREAVEATGAMFVDTVPLTADEKGRYRRRAKVDGRTRIIRATDGMHMTAHGAKMVSREIVALLQSRADESTL